MIVLGVRTRRTVRKAKSGILGAEVFRCPVRVKVHNVVRAPATSGGFELIVYEKGFQVSLRHAGRLDTLPYSIWLFPGGTSEIRRETVGQHPAFAQAIVVKERRARSDLALDAGSFQNQAWAALMNTGADITGFGS